jgi:hypothetical protein
VKGGVTDLSEPIQIIFAEKAPSSCPDNNRPFHCSKTGNF